MLTGPGRGRISVSGAIGYSELGFSSRDFGKVRIKQAPNGFDSAEMKEPRGDKAQQIKDLHICPE